VADDPPSPTGVGSSAASVVCADEQREIDVDTSRWAELARRALEAEGAAGELTLTFVDVEEIESLNREYMGADEPTDVLSFPLDDAVTRGGDDGTPVLLGDVVICPSVAASSAPSHAGTLDDELALLVVHGVLHVLGHDHDGPEDATRVRERERELLRAHHWHGDEPAGFSQEHLQP
jgi:probable rRNA maturation factor